MKTIPELIAQAYQARLSALGIPVEPAQRTAAQANEATVIFWAVQNEYILAASGLTQAGMEVQ